MPNLKSVRANFALYGKAERELLARWNDKQAEQGYNVESGRALEDWFKHRKKPTTEQEKQCGSTL